MKHKGQVSPDFLVAIILLGIMALTVFGVYGHMQSETFTTIERLYMKDIARDIAGAVNSVVVMGDGASKSVSLPATVSDGRKYNITLRANAVLIRSGDADYAMRFATANINQTEIRLEPGEILIENKNGRIYFDKVA